MQSPSLFLPITMSFFSFEANILCLLISVNFKCCWEMFALRTAWLDTSNGHTKIAAVWFTLFEKIGIIFCCKLAHIMQSPYVHVILHIINFWFCFILNWFETSLLEGILYFSVILYANNLLLVLSPQCMYKLYILFYKMFWPFMAIIILAVLGITYDTVADSYM